MARIRTIKPEFFRHEGLQDIEAENPGAYCMLVFAGLWGHCDKAGRFEWRPRTLKLDILPFLSFDMAETLAILERAGQVRRYQVDGKEYGEIASFCVHQRISGKEAQEPEKHPEPIKEDIGKKRGSNGEAPETAGREGKGRGKGKGREREEEGNGLVTPAVAVDPPPESATWESYATAYRERYRVDPVSNAKVRSQISQFCRRIPRDEAPSVAAFYVGLNKAFYVQSGHPVGPLLQDCESLRTQWVTGRTLTVAAARQADATQARGNVFRELIEESNAKAA